MFASAPQKLYLQKQDLKYLYTQIKKAATEKLNLHLPPTINDGKVTKSKSKRKKRMSKVSTSEFNLGDDDDIINDDDDDDEQDSVRRIVNRTLGDYIIESFVMSKYSLVIDGKEYNIVSDKKKSESDDVKDSDDIRNILLEDKEKEKNSKGGTASDEEIEVEPFDFNLNERIRKIYYECESLTTEITKKRYEIPTQRYKKAFEKLTNENLRKFEELEELVNSQIEENSVSNNHKSNNNTASHSEENNEDMSIGPNQVNALKESIKSYTAGDNNGMVEDFEYSLEKLIKYKDNTNKTKDQLFKLMQLVEFLEGTS